MSAARLMQLLACIAAFLALVLAVNAVVVPRVLGPSAGSVSHSNANGSSSASGPPSPGDGNWTQTGTPPFLRERSAVAYDSQSDQVVLFGGLQGLDFQNDTWAYDPSTASWTNDTIGTAPAARVDAAMAYDGGAQRVIIFGGAWWVWDPSGGILYGKTYADTWAYDSVNKTWTELHPIDSPPALTGAWMVYDTAAKRLILFGGYTFHSFLGVTWAYDYENNTWTNLTRGASPSPRTGASLSYDGSEDRVILFGGNDGRTSGIFLDDTWSFDYSSRTWVQLNPLLKPSPRFAAPFVFDSSTGVNLLFSGYPSNSETWTYSAVADNWTRSNPASSPPWTMDSLLVFVTSASRPLLVDLRDGYGPSGTWWFIYSPTAPTAPQGLQASGSSGGVRLNWSYPASDGGSLVTSYRIYRGTVAGGETLLSTVPSVLTYLDTPLARGQTYYYQVSAISAIGEGARSTEVYATPVAPVDTTPPTIAITQPANNSVLAEATVDVAGTAADDVAIQVVELSADGTKWTRATGTGSWSGTLALSTGTNSILARASDSSGNTRTATIKVTVQSTGSPMPSFLSPALLAAILTTAAVLAAAVLLRSRRRKRVNQPPRGTS